tara:strand:- start:255 stop:542 length:288 start_codon:yes stop_codon:yes gene_type:complete
MDCYPQKDGETDVVVIVHWTCAGTDGTYYGSVYGTCSVPTPSETFTPYADLTQDQVLGWIWANGVDKIATEANVAQQIEIQVNPPVITPPLPWAA